MAHPHPQTTENSVALPSGGTHARVGTAEATPHEPYRNTGTTECPAKPAKDGNTLHVAGNTTTYSRQTGLLHKHHP